MRLEVRKYLFDIQQACRHLTAFTAGRTLEGYASDPMLRSAVERQFEIVGEALAQLRKIEPRVVEAVSEASRVVAFRNILIHGYADVDDRLVWNIVETKLPTLAQEVDTLLGQIPTGNVEDTRAARSQNGAVQGHSL